MPRGTILVFAAVVVVLAAATQVDQCGNSVPYDDTNQVKISGCEKPPCKLKRRTQASIEQKFVPDRDIQTLTTSVNAAILGVPLPFVGVDGANACDNIYHADGSKAGCPLKKGVEYVYKNSFPILQIYPTLSMIIHYALVDGQDVITCFEVPSKIVN